MIIYNIYYRFQLKEPVLLRLKGPTTHTHTAFTEEAEQIILIEIYVVCPHIMITVSFY